MDDPEAPANALPLSTDLARWSAELQEIVTESHPVMRLRGHFPRSAMSSDIVFQRGTVDTDNGIYERTVTRHEDRWVDDDHGEATDPVFEDADGTCAVSGSLEGSRVGRAAKRAAFPGLVLLVALVLLRRRLGRG